MAWSPGVSLVFFFIKIIEWCLQCGRGLAVALSPGVSLVFFFIKIIGCFFVMRERLGCGLVSWGLSRLLFCKNS